MKYVKVSHGYNTPAKLDAADYLSDWVPGFWFEVPEDILEELKDAPLGRYVIVNTCKGLTVGRIVDAANDPEGIEQVDGEKIKPTQPVVDLVSARSLKTFQRAHQRKVDVKECEIISKQIEALSKRRSDLLIRLTTEGEDQK